MTANRKPYWHLGYLISTEGQPQLKARTCGFLSRLTGLLPRFFLSEGVSIINQPMNTVLVVEDSVPQREMITDLLKGSGLDVTVAGDGMEALESIQGTMPDVVVLDIVMPRMNGYEFCRRLKADPVTQNVPVVMCSSKGEEFDRYWGMKQGADAYIAKPFQPMELIGTVKQLLRG